jgi:serine/threonine protein kinase
MELMKLNICHRDIKLENIIIIGNDLLADKSVKIADYGISYKGSDSSASLLKSNT